MDNTAIHNAIQKKFHHSNKTKMNLPYCSGFRFSRNDLAELLGELKYNVGAEVGVRIGSYSVRLCKCNPELHLFSIDPWAAIDRKYPKEKQEIIYTRAVKNLAPYNATIIRKTSMDALADFKDGSLDFIYIDGNHHYDFIACDIIHWAPKVRRGGIMAVHDFYGGEIGVQKAVEGYVISHDIRPWYITKELAPTAYWVMP